MPKTEIDKIAKELFIKSVCKITKKNTAAEFFSDLLSSSEVKDISRRLLAVQYLFNGKTYLEIQKDLGMGMATINKMRFKTKGSRTLKKLLS